VPVFINHLFINNGMMRAMPPTVPASSSWRLLVAVCAVTLLCTIGVAMPYPILAPIFVDGPADGFTHFAGMPPEWLLGVALAANPAGILLGSLVLGPLSDRLGRRRVLVVTLLACALGYLDRRGRRRGTCSSRRGSLSG
jgi:MFS family permease